MCEQEAISVQKFEEIRKVKHHATIPVIDFIDGQLVPALEKMVKCGLQYYAFSILCQGIELLGSFYDSHKLDTPGKTEERFKKAIRNLFKGKDKDKYRSNLANFYKLRGNLIHQLRPEADFLLTSELHDGAKRAYHFEENESGKIFLVIKQFIDDFKAAVKTLKNNIKKKRCHPDTLGGLFLDREKTPFINIGPESIAIQNGNTQSPWVTGGPPPSSLA